jgi:hypothetical protein
MIQGKRGDGSLRYFIVYENHPHRKQKRPFACTLAGNLL